MSLFLLLWRGTFSERLTDPSCQEFSFWFFGISLALVKTDSKNVLLNSLFFQELACLFFLFVSYLPAIC